MLIFIDESGDAGFKIAIGSSRYFVIALVIFDKIGDADNLTHIIEKFKESLGKGKRAELKFNKCKRETRIAFLKLVVGENFRVRCLVVDKVKFSIGSLKNSKESFYSFFIMEVLKRATGTIKSAKLRLDGEGEKLYQKSFYTYLRKALNSGEVVIVQDLKFRDSKQDALIQLADMVAGSVRRSYEDSKKDSQEYRKIIQKKIEDCWEI